MAEKNNATCSICGKGYYKCISCKHQINSAPWKMYTDTSEHYKIFQVIHGLNTGVYSKEEAKKKLQNIDLSDLNELRDSVKNTIKEILKEDKKTQKVEEVVEDVAVPVETQGELQAPSVNRKKKNFNPVGFDEDKGE